MARGQRAGRAGRVDRGAPRRLSMRMVPLPVGQEVLLGAGDWLSVEDPKDDVRNAGGDDVVLLVAGSTRLGEPFTSFFAP